MEVRMLRSGTGKREKALQKAFEASRQESGHARSA
jgi:hypothetical protein